MAGDVMTTATAGAGGAARIEKTADSAQVNGQVRGDTDQETATRPQNGAPGNVQVSPREKTPRTPRGVPDGTGNGAETRPARPARPTRQGLAPAAQPASPGAGVRRRLARLGAQRGSSVNPVLEPLIKTIRAHHPKADVRTDEQEVLAAADAARARVNRLLDHLDTRTREVIRMRTGIDGSQEMTLEQIGQHFGITKERVRQINVRGMKQLREWAAKENSDGP